MRTIKATREVCDRMLRYAKKNPGSEYSMHTEWRCNKSGWNIAYADDCVVSTKHTYYSKEIDHTDNHDGMYHVWCRKLCDYCNNPKYDDPHTFCDQKLEEQKRIAMQEVAEREIQTVDDMMYNNLIKEKLK